MGTTTGGPETRPRLGPQICTFFFFFFLSYFTNNLYFSLVYEWITAWDKRGLETHRALKYVQHGLETQHVSSL